MKNFLISIFTQKQQYKANMTGVFGGEIKELECEMRDFIKYFCIT